MKLPLFSLSPTNLNAGSVRDWENMEDLEIQTPDGAGDDRERFLSAGKERAALRRSAGVASMMAGPPPTREPLKSPKPSKSRRPRLRW